MKDVNEIERLRRSGATTAAMVAVLAVFPTVTMTHHHLWLGFVGIGMQVVLLAIAMSQLAKAKKLAAEQKK
ncbi:MAG TPA: hypothetical protein VHZ25_13030 [Acidobacteriaceae bacterium]|jgi:hypothetical protein|nr:hypothetical protein [Acidobacteriaceae bacterium]